MDRQIDASLAGADDGSKAAYARPKSKLGELTKHKDLPRSENDANQPFYHEHTVLSQAAYDPIKFKSNCQQLGYEVDNELSQPSRKVFYNKSKNKAVVAYKGIDPKHIYDLIVDGQIFNAMDEYLSGRFRADKAYRNTAKKYGKENVQVTGHSLGGSQAVHVGRKYGVEGTAFKPGSGVAGAFQRAREDIGDAASNKLLSGIHNVFSKTISPEKKRTGVQIGDSAYRPLPAIGKTDGPICFTMPSMRFLLCIICQVAKKGHGSKLNTRTIIQLRILCNDSIGARCRSCINQSNFSRRGSVAWPLVHCCVTLPHPRT